MPGAGGTRLATTGAERRKSGLRNSERVPSPDKRRARDPVSERKKKPEDKVLGKKERGERGPSRVKESEKTSQNFFQVLGKNKISKGNSSNLPASISKVKIILENPENAAKFCVGPTASSPGPILFRVAATAVKFVVKLKLSIEISNVENANTIM